MSPKDTDKNLFTKGSPSVPSARKDFDEVDEMASTHDHRNGASTSAQMMVQPAQMRVLTAMYGNGNGVGL